MYKRNIEKIVACLGFCLAIENHYPLYGYHDKLSRQVSSSNHTKTSKRKEKKPKDFIAIGVLGTAAFTLIPLLIYQKTKNVPVSPSKPLSPLLVSDMVFSSTDSEASQSTSAKNAIHFDSHYLDDGDPIIIDNKDFSLEPDSISPFKKYLIPGWVRENTKHYIPKDILGLIHQHSIPTPYVHVFEDDLVAFTKQGDIAFSRKSGKMYNIPKPYDRNNTRTLYKTIKSVPVPEDYSEWRDRPYLSQQGDKLILGNRIAETLSVIETKTDTVLYKTSYCHTLFKADANLLLVQTENKIMLWPLAKEKPISLPFDSYTPSFNDFDAWRPRISLDRKTVVCPFVNENKKITIGVWHLGTKWQEGQDITYHKINTMLNGCDELLISPNGDTLVLIVGPNGATSLPSRKRLLGWQLNLKQHVYEKKFDLETGRMIIKTALYALDNKIYLNMSDFKSDSTWNSYCVTFEELANQANFNVRNNSLRGYHILLLGQKKHILVKDTQANFHTYCPEYASNIALNQQGTKSPIPHAMIKLKSPAKSDDFQTTIRYNKASVVVSGNRDELKVTILDDELHFIRDLVFSEAFSTNPNIVKASKNYEYLAILQENIGTIILHIYDFNKVLSKNEKLSTVEPLHSVDIKKYLLEQTSLQEEDIEKTLFYPIFDVIEGNRFVLRFRIAKSRNSQNRYYSVLIGLR